MVLIGLLLLAAATAAGIDAAWQNRVAVQAHAAGTTWTSTPAAFLAAGVVIGVVACIGLLLVVDGVRRARIRRAERRELEESHARLLELGHRDRFDESIDLRDRTRHDAPAERHPAMASNGTGTPPSGDDRMG